ncbi:MAG: hypothetical protein WCY60_09400 [Trueperaceae bacterium]
MARLAVFTERYTIRSSVELTALTNFRLAAFELGHDLDFLFKNELKYIRNYDGILIRALTDPLNTSYVVARHAEVLGKRVLDHSSAILICCDKVNMYKRLASREVPIPDTRYVAEEDLTAFTAVRLFEELGTPLVLKAPNSSFSAYVDRVTTPEEFVKTGRRFLRRADLIVVQQYLPSDFDWRVITLAGRVLAVVKYAFAPAQWKLMDRTAEGEWANVIGVDPATAHPRLLSTALAASNAIGQSLYGVDLKEIDGEYYVIEVNDNPTIAAGEEDQSSPGIYSEIIKYLATGE